MIWAQTIVNGLLLGGLYGLFGLGLAFSFGIMRLVNVAHGEFIVLAAYLGASLLSLVPVSPFVVILPVCAAMFAIGWALQSALLNRVVDKGPIPPMLITFGLSIVVRNLLVQIYTADVRAIHVGGIELKGWTIGGLTVGAFPLIVFSATLIVFLTLQFIISKTMVGRVLRATADDREIVQTFGVNYRQVYNAALGLAVALSALAGLLLAMRSSFSPFAGQDRLLISFEVVIVGGLGSFWGALLGGLALGVAQVVGLKISPNSGLLFAHIAFFSILFVRSFDLRGTTWGRAS